MHDPYLQRKILFLAVFVSFCACLQVFKDSFIYWQASLLEDFWRLWTAHWVHVGWIHYALNMLAFICLPFIFPRTSIWHFIVLLFVLPVLISLSFYYFLTDIQAYAGLSGVLHGAYVAVACVHLLYSRERNFAALVLFLIFAKLVWENTMGTSTTAELIGSPVLVEAHLLGVIWGILISNIYIVANFLRD